MSRLAKLRATFQQRMGEVMQQVGACCPSVTQLTSNQHPIQHLGRPCAEPTGQSCYACCGCLLCLLSLLSSAAQGPRHPSTLQLPSPPPHLSGPTLCSSPLLRPPSVRLLPRCLPPLPANPIPPTPPHPVVQRRQLFQRLGSHLTSEMPSSLHAMQGLTDHWLRVGFVLF